MNVTYRYEKERRYRKKDKNNLVDEDFKKLTKEFEKGNFPGPRAVDVYKHPIKTRAKIKSRGQTKSVRRRHGL